MATEYNVRIWKTDKGTWKVSKTIVDAKGRALTSNTTKEVAYAFDLATAFIDEGRKTEGAFDLMAKPPAAKSA